MAVSARTRQLSVSLPDEQRCEVMRIVLDYESSLRGLRRGQTLVRMILKAADLDAYPEDLRRKLDELGTEQSLGAYRTHRNTLGRPRS